MIIFEIKLCVYAHNTLKLLLLFAFGSSGVVDIRPCPTDGSTAY
jgi:hypothetical protein